MAKIIPFPRMDLNAPEDIPLDLTDPMWLFNSFMQELEDNGVMDELRALPKKRPRRNMG